MQASDTILYAGTCDNLDCAGETFGDCNPTETPIRVYEDGDGRLWLQAKGITEVDAENEVYEWDEYDNDAAPIRMRDWNPTPSPELLARLIEQGILNS